jgi:hypothetical protein
MIERSRYFRTAVGTTPSAWVILHPDGGNAYKNHPLDGFSIEPDSRVGKLRLAPTPIFTQEGMEGFFIS